MSHTGTVQVDKHRYYIGRNLVGGYLVLKLDAHRREFEVMGNNQVIKTMPIKGLYNQPLEFGRYLDLMVQRAEAEWRRLQRNQRRRAA